MRLSVFSWAVLILITLALISALPALAGKVTLINNSPTNYYQVSYQSWLFGAWEPVTICADPKKTAWGDGVFNSIGIISVYDAGPGTIRSDTGEFIKPECPEPSSFLEYKGTLKPDGNYWPHRTFTVTVYPAGHIEISED